MSAEPAQPEKLTLDAAVAQFNLLLREYLGSRIYTGSYDPEPPEITDARYFRWAQMLIRLACPDPAACANRRCRRGGCRHPADLAATRKAPPLQEIEGRPPAIHALRHAIWVYMNAQLRAAGEASTSRATPPSRPE
jgi:hypothetical protein